MTALLDGLVGQDIIAFNATSEIYGSARMLLACVEDRAVFDAVIGGCGGSDFMAELEPMRSVRPSKVELGRYCSPPRHLMHFEPSFLLSNVASSVDVVASNI